MPPSRHADAGMCAASAGGDELTATYREVSATASFNTWAGFEVVRMAEGECELMMSWRAAEMGQYAGFPHAGVIAALLDTACGFAAHTTATGVLSSNLAVSYLAPAVGDEFVASGRVIGGTQANLATRPLQLCG